MFTKRTSSTIDDFCKRHGICRATAYNEINRGRLRSFKIGRIRRISEEAENEYIRLREQEAVA